MKSLFKNIVVRILTAEAAFLLRRKKPTIIAITGSVGKTSTKDAVYAAIKNNVRARKNEKSFNSELGVPLTVLGLPNAWNNPFLWIRNIIDGAVTALFPGNYPDVLILEAGIDRPGDMERLTRWLKPDIAVVTRLPAVPVHVEYFSSPEEVIVEKMKLATALKPEGVFVYNADDTLIEAQLEHVLQKQIGYGRYTSSDVKASKDKTIYRDARPVGVSFTVQSDGEEGVVIIDNTIGTQHMYAVLAALGVAEALQVPFADAVRSLGSLRSPNGRARIIPGIKSTTLIDDTYNSSPIAAENALESFKELKYTKRKIAVLGDMLELGKYSPDEHYKLGQRAAESCDVLFTVGVRSRKIAEGALASGLPEKVVFQYDDGARAGSELQNYMQSGDAILIKASQGVRAERIVEEVMEDPNSAGSLLVRQDPVWRAKV